jgi:hypothetical protein
VRLARIAVPVPPVAIRLDRKSLVPTTKSTLAPWCYSVPPSGHSLPWWIDVQSWNRTSCPAQRHNVHERELGAAMAHGIEEFPCKVLNPRPESNRDENPYSR